MNIIGLGTNYITEVFTLVSRSVSSAFAWFQTILQAIGLPWEIYMLVIIGFAVVSFVVSASFGAFRSEADTAITSTYNYSVREFKKGNKE